MTDFSSIPQVLYDIYLVYGNDFVLSSTKDLLLANETNLSQQRVIRRLLTTPLSYIWQSDYGAGLPNFVGDILSLDNFDNIKALITSQIFLESSVAQTPTPEIFLQSIQFGLFCQINYTIAPSQQPIVLTFDVSQ